MPKKHTIDDIRNIINEKFGDELILKSDTYINNRQPLLFQCKCGNEFLKPFQAINVGHIRCKECSSKLHSQVNRFDFNIVLNILKENDCEYISGEYLNNKSKLLLRCKCGNKFERDIQHIMRGQNTCLECSLQRQSEMFRKPFEDVLRDITNGGCQYISGEYINSDSILKLKCSCGNIFYKSLNKYNSGQNRCPECGNKSSIDSRRKYLIEDSPYMDINHDIRYSKEIIQWKNKIIENYNKQCAITGETDNLDVHHLLSFSDIFYNTCLEYDQDISLYDNIIKIPSTEIYNKIKENVIKKHNMDVGILISHDLHIMFHSIYGYHNNTPEQFDDFLKSEFNTSLKNIIR